jgi:hypothetical protein
MRSPSPELVALAGPNGAGMEDAGFLQGQPYEIQVSRGKLVLRTV